MVFMIAVVGTLAAGFGGTIAVKTAAIPTLTVVGGFAANRRTAQEEEAPPDIITFQSGSTTMALPEDDLLEFGYYVAQREKPDYIPELITDERFSQLLAEGKMLGQAFIQAGHLSHRPAA